MDICEKKMTIDIENGVRAYKLKNEKGQVMFILAIFREPRSGNWIVKVREVTDLYYPRDVVREFYQDRKTAEIQLQKLIRDYTHLIASQQERCINPRLVFDDAVNYHTVTPHCCLNCEFSTVDFQPPKEGRKPKPPKLICKQRKNMKEYTEIWDEFGEDGICNHHQNWAYSPIPVQCNGICNNYAGPKDVNASRIRPRWEGKCCYENDRDLIDLINTIYDNKIRVFEDEIFIRPDGTYNKTFESSVIDIANTQISGAILSGPILSALGNELSAGTLSAPVIHVVNNVINEIDISAIIGNKNVQDYNSDGVIDEEEEMAYIIGGLGA